MMSTESGAQAKSMVNDNIPINEINLLILGETGVGKSTFINGFVNYLTFDTLEEAQRDSTLTSLIACSFDVSDPITMEQTTVTTGKADNEVFTTGQSATQSAQVYKFPVGQYTLRIIDTPGVGDVRGIQKDTENFKNIIDTISNLDHLNGILILLKPNNSRISVMFRFCIQELLSHLHKSAADKIVFGFTNCRGTFYAPGDTMRPLKALLDNNKVVKLPLNKDTIYCFDSESFRFLAATHQGLKFDDDTTMQFSNSWNRSVKETHRLFKHILGTRPHLIHDTTSLNSARNLIIKLTKPLAEVTRLIDVNRKVCKQQVDELQNTKKHGEELDKLLMVKKIDLEGRELGYPRTVCTNSKCIDVREWEGIQKINYKTHCHEHCFLEGVRVDTLNTPLLTKCLAMKGGQSCSVCGHGYQEHMHVIYELFEVSKQVKDSNVEDGIRKNVSDKEKKERTIAQLKQMVKEYEEEHKVVETAAAEFACFLKHNAILPYADARIEYLDHLLNEERAKAQVSGDDSMVKSMEETKRMYLEEFHIIDNAVTEGRNAKLLDPKHVAVVEGELYKLKHFGETLKKVRDSGAAAHKITYKEVDFKPPNGKKSSWVSELKETFFGR